MDAWLIGVLWTALGLALLAVGVAALRSRHPLRSVLSSGVQGLCALGAVNLLGGLTRVSLGFSWLAAGVGFFGGIPGVIGLLLLKIIFPVM